MDVPELVNLETAKYVGRLGLDYVITKMTLDPMWGRFRPRLVSMLQRADERLDGRLPLVPERTLVAAVEVVKSTDDVLVADYLGGVLAASGEDDSGTPIVQLIARLSSRDLRAHFVLYREFQRLMPNVRYVADTTSIATHVYVPMPELLAGLGVENERRGLLAAKASLTNLINEGLLGDVLHSGTNGSPPEGFIFGEVDTLSRWFDRVPFPTFGAVVTPCAFGESLLAWGCGVRDPSPMTFRSMTIPTVGDAEIPRCPSAKLLNDL